MPLPEDDYSLTDAELRGELARLRRDGNRLARTAVTAFAFWLKLPDAGGSADEFLKGSGL